MILMSAITFAVYWLWQRQPKGNIIPQSNSPTASEQANIDQSKEEEIEILNPKDNSVLQSSSFSLAGKTEPNSYIVIFSDSASQITKSDEKGDFKTELTIGNKLNLIDVQVLTNNLEPKFKKTLTYFLGKNLENSVVYTGEVKTTFDTVITITSYGNEIGIRTNNQTEFNLPQIEPSQQEQGIKGIRIGDFAIVIGTQNKDVVTASEVNILRENIPQNSKQFEIVKLLTNSKSRFFSSKDDKGQIHEFTLASDSQIKENMQEAEESDIQKEKSAIIIFHEQKGKKIADDLYLIAQH